jgi:hypothetical protein
MSLMPCLFAFIIRPGEDRVCPGDKVINRTDRIYRRTQAGVRALKSRNSVPEWYRVVLKSIRGKTGSGAICAAMRSYPEKQVRYWLEELETLGFVEMVDSAPSLPSPDITGRFSLHSLRVQRHAA